MRRDLLFRVHESCQDHKHPETVSLFAFSEVVDVEIGEAYSTTSIDLLDDLDPELAERIRAGETVRCRLEIVE